MRPSRLPALPLRPHVARRLALGLAAMRAGLGVTALAAPTLASRPWIGEDAARAGTRLFGRAMGGRDLALGAGALLAARSGLPVRGWVAAGALADLSDTVATATSYRHLPRRSRPLVLAVTLGATVAAVLLLPLVDGPRR